MRAGRPDLATWAAQAACPVPRIRSNVGCRSAIVWTEHAQELVLQGSLRPLGSARPPRHAEHFIADCELVGTARIDFYGS